MTLCFRSYVIINFIVPAPSDIQKRSEEITLCYNNSTIGQGIILTCYVNTLFELTDSECMLIDVDVKLFRLAFIFSHIREFKRSESQSFRATSEATETIFPLKYDDGSWLKAFNSMNSAGESIVLSNC